MLEVPRFLDSKVFKHLIGYITLYAIDYVKREWEGARELRNDEVLVGQELEDCLLSSLTRWPGVVSSDGASLSCLTHR